jgi:hypothetical protein
MRPTHRRAVPDSVHIPYGRALDPQVRVYLNGLSVHLVWQQARHTRRKGVHRDARGPQDEVRRDRVLGGRAVCATGAVNHVVWVNGFNASDSVSLGPARGRGGRTGLT